MLWHCVDNSSYQGCALPERPAAPCDNEYNGENSCLTYNDDNALPSNNGGWDQPSNNGEWDQPSNNGQWDQEDPPYSEFHKPVTDEAEWSDGWTLN